MAAELLGVGGGGRGRALVAGLIAAGRAEEEFAVVEVIAAQRERIAADHPGITVSEAPVPAANAVIAVKPPDVPAAAKGAAEAGAGRILSVAAGGSTAAI